MPFKLTKDHIGKKVRSIHWSKDDFGFPLYVSDTWVVFKDKWGGEDVCSVGESTAWEFYEEPTPKVWWEEGKVYRKKSTNQFCRFNKVSRYFLEIEFSAQPDFLNSYTCSVTSALDWHQEDFEEVGIHTVPNGMSPQELLESLKSKRVKTYCPECNITYSGSPNLHEHVKPKTIRMAPALYRKKDDKEDNVVMSSALYASEEKAREAINSFASPYYNYTFIQWPASESLWVNAPVEEKPNGE